MNATAYNNWIHQQLEPEDFIIVGKRDLRPPTFIKQQQIQFDIIKNLQWQYEDNAQQDAYLKSKGIN